MIRELRPALVLFALMMVVTGILYPFAVTGIAQIAFPHQANGSLIEKNGTVIGSELIGQKFIDPRYFHGRPSSAGTGGYDANASSGSNYGPTSKALADRVAGDVDKARSDGVSGPIPADMATASASGLDPDISPDNAEAQVAGVAAARNLPADRVRALVAEASEGRDLGFLGEPRVNVLKLNLLLDGS